MMEPAGQAGMALSATTAAIDGAMAEELTPAAPAATVSPPTATVPVTMPTAEALPGLSSWLAALNLSKYLEAASCWVEEQGAGDLNELVENLEDFADRLDMKKLERIRLRKGAK